MDCIFCKIIDGDIPSEKIYEDDFILGIKDINPQAPVHIIFFPKKHILDDAFGITEENSEIIAKMFLAIKKTAEKLELQNGFRIVNNCRENGKQSVRHFHLHLLGGRMLDGEMG